MKTPKILGFGIISTLTVLSLAASAFAGEPTVRIDFTRWRRPLGITTVPTNVENAIKNPGNEFGSTYMRVIPMIEIEPGGQVNVFVKGAIFGDTGGVGGSATAIARFSSLEAYNHAVAGDRDLAISPKDLRELREMGNSVGISGERSVSHTDLNELPISRALLARILGSGALPSDVSVDSINLESVQLAKNGTVILNVSAALLGDAGGVSGSFRGKVDGLTLNELNQLQSTKAAPLKPSDFKHPSVSFWKDGVWSAGFVRKTSLQEAEESREFPLARGNTCRDLFK